MTSKFNQQSLTTEMNEEQSTYTFTYTFDDNSTYISPVYDISDPNNEDETALLIRRMGVFGFQAEDIIEVKNRWK